ncbi:MAG: NAD(P)-dependent oxidoreductase [Armatimonadota bacterium]|nr:NAD(P)-dependent oxidoreductase [Armatimonadota bacterium]MDR7454718.1 NAD(P)-dependent oxidoreductase [Armatimonadota bacterium]MDR7457321.1 NAD(P)-dependent oxidoreductase [Armatimonadota bacterium]MDR7512274.1 NAD(P)-dependent oxidoreductase [Armatimonadota bacterium]
MARVLVTGGAGYIGSVLTGALLEAGHDVTVLDRFFFGREPLGTVADHPRLRLVHDDIRWCAPEVFEGIEVVLDLAALSNDPSGELDPERTMEINHRGRVRVARLARERGAARYILASSCSIYGFRDDTVLDETSPPAPLTTYARANLLAEQETLPLAGRGFTVTVLRQATVYGLSPRMRFDLAINGMVLGLYRTGRIPVLRDGRQWRPFVHVRDTVQAFLLAAAAPPEQVSGQIFNVGSDDQNVQVLPLAELVARATGREAAVEWYGQPDHRSYRVSFRKCREVLGFVPRWTPASGAREVMEALKAGHVTDDPRTRTVAWYRTLLEGGEAPEGVVMRGRVL